MINVSNNPPSAPMSSIPQQQAPIPAAAEVTPQSANPVQPSPSEKNNKLFLIGGVVLAVLIVGFLASLFLTQKPQEIRQQAAQCVEQCPGNDGVLRSCTPPEADGSSADSTCNVKGRVEPCGGVNYCCPAPGGTWTTNMTACATPTPEPSATPIPGACSTDSTNGCSNANPGDYCNNGAGSCTSSTNNGADSKPLCVCATPTPVATATPTATPTSVPTTAPTAAPTTAATTAPTNAPTTAPTTAATTAPTQPPLPSKLPETGPADWLKNLTIGLGAIGAGALIFLFL